MYVCTCIKNTSVLNSNDRNNVSLLQSLEVIGLHILFNLLIL